MQQNGDAESSFKLHYLIDLRYYDASFPQVDFSNRIMLHFCGPRGLRSPDLDIMSVLLHLLSYGPELIYL